MGSFPAQINFLSAVCDSSTFTHSAFLQEAQLHSSQCSAAAQANNLQVQESTAPGGESEVFPEQPPAPDAAATSIATISRAILSASKGATPEELADFIMKISRSSSATSADGEIASASHEKAKDNTAKKSVTNESRGMQPKQIQTRSKIPQLRHISPGEKARSGDHTPEIYKREHVVVSTKGSKIPVFNGSKLKITVFRADQAKSNGKPLIGQGEKKAVIGQPLHSPVRNRNSEPVSDLDATLTPTADEDSVRIVDGLSRSQREAQSRTAENHRPGDTAKSAVKQSEDGDFSQEKAPSQVATSKPLTGSSVAQDGPQIGSTATEKAESKLQEVQHKAQDTDMTPPGAPPAAGPAGVRAVHASRYSSTPMNPFAARDNITLTSSGESISVINPTGSGERLGFLPSSGESLGLTPEDEQPGPTGTEVVGRRPSARISRYDEDQVLDSHQSTPKRERPNTRPRTIDHVPLDNNRGEPVVNGENPPESVINNNQADFLDRRNLLDNGEVRNQLNNSYTTQAVSKSPVHRRISADQSTDHVNNNMTAENIPLESASTNVTETFRLQPSSLGSRAVQNVQNKGQNVHAESANLITREYASTTRSHLPLSNGPPITAADVLFPSLARDASSGAIEPRGASMENHSANSTQRTASVPHRMPVQDLKSYYASSGSASGRIAPSGSELNEPRSSSLDAASVSFPPSATATTVLRSPSGPQRVLPPSSQHRRGFSSLPDDVCRGKNCFPHQIL